MKKQASLLLAGMLLITSLSACGESPEPNTGEENGEHSSITLRNYMALPTTDPADTNETGVLTVNEQIYEGLYALNEAEGGYDKLLAKEVEISDDGTIYDITLQDGVKFHNGETMTSADVVFSYEHFMANSKYNTYTNMIVDVEAVDDTHVRITLDRPYSPILHTFYKVKILSQKEVESQGDEFGTVANLAGTGPYSWDLDAYKPTTSWTLNAFEDYWQGAPSIKTINYVVIEDDAAAVIALENGEIDWMTVPLANWDDIKNSGKFATDERQSNEIFFLSINWEASDILANDKVREAIAYLSDRLLTQGNTVAALDELYLWLSNLTTIEYIRNCLKRVRKRNSALILASQNLEDFDVQGVRELTRPLFAIPTHQFLFHGGKVDRKFYMDNLQMESAEYDLISSPQRGVCLFKSGADRNLLDVHAPPHKHVLITGGDG